MEQQRIAEGVGRCSRFDLEPCGRDGLDAVVMVPQGECELRCRRGGKCIDDPVVTQCVSVAEGVGPVFAEELAGLMELARAREGNGEREAVVSRGLVGGLLALIAEGGREKGGMGLLPRVAQRDADIVDDLTTRSGGSEERYRVIDAEVQDGVREDRKAAFFERTHTRGDGRLVRPDEEHQLSETGIEEAFRCHLAARNGVHHA